MTGTRPTAVLVVGATGILRPAVLALARDGRRVVAVGRDRGRLEALAEEVRSSGATGEVDLLALDATSERGAEVLLARLRRLGVVDALVYEPAVAPAVVRGVADGSALMVLVRPSALAEPRPGEADDAAFPLNRVPLPDPRVVQLLLGWSGAGPAARWHTPAEVSAAARASLRDGMHRVLGAVRPWSDRPGA